MAPAYSFSTGFGSGQSSSKQQSQSGEAYSPEALGRINELYPYLRKQLPGQGQMDFGSLLGGVGGQTQPYPDVTVGGVFGPEQIQQRVNAMKAQSQAATGGQIRQTQQRLAGTGYGGNSPLFQEQRSNLMAQNQASNTSAENDLRFQAARDNAQHLLATQQAALQGRQAQGEEDVRRRQLAVGQYGQLAQQQSALLNALYGYNRPLSFGKAEAKSGSQNQNQNVSVSRGAYDDPLGLFGQG